MSQAVWKNKIGSKWATGGCLLHSDKLPQCCSVWCWASHVLFKTATSRKNAFSQHSLLETDLRSLQKYDKEHEYSYFFILFFYFPFQDSPIGVLMRTNCIAPYQTALTAALTSSCRRRPWVSWVKSTVTVLNWGRGWMRRRKKKLKHESSLIIFTVEPIYSWIATMQLITINCD